MDADGEWIVGHRVAVTGISELYPKLLRMAAISLEECLANVPFKDWQQIPLLLCLGEPERVGCPLVSADIFIADLGRELQVTFPHESAVISWGHAAVGIALHRARELIHQKNFCLVLIVAVDSLLFGPTLTVLERENRLLTSSNSDGFMPGEAAGALLIGPPASGEQLQCDGIGFGVEPSDTEPGRPLRAEGLTTAIRSALNQAGCRIDEFDFRIADLAGEQKSFKELALATARILRIRTEQIPIWHPADCIGEVGAAAGVCMLAVADAACRKGYAPGPNILMHTSNDRGERVAATLHFRGG